jgi:DNA polymerase III epsilon subunit family exonuclease
VPFRRASPDFGEAGAVAHAMDRKIDKVDFVIFDVETTGLLPKNGDRIIEIAAVRYKNGESRDLFSSLINPQREISAAAFEVNHISQEMVEGAPLSSEILPKFLGFIGNSCLAGYNVSFDLGFLENELKLSGRNLPQDIAVVDVMQMARRIIPDMDRYGLVNVVRHLGINIPQGHRALSDCRLTAAVFSRLLSLLKEKGLDSYLQFYNLFGVNPKITEDINSQRLSAIQKAIDFGLQLKIKYYSSSRAQVTERQVAPREIRREGKSTYIVGYCHLRKDERTFKLNAILDLEINRLQA